MEGEEGGGREEQECRVGFEGGLEGLREVRKGGLVGLGRKRHSPSAAGFQIASSKCHARNRGMHTPGATQGYWCWLSPTTVSLLVAPGGNGTG